MRFNHIHWHTCHTREQAGKTSEYHSVRCSLRHSCSKNDKWSGEWASTKLSCNWSLMGEKDARGGLAHGQAPSRIIQITELTNARLG